MNQLYKQIIHIITQHLKPEKIILFGSRAMNTHTKTSDIDIAIVGHDINDQDIAILKDMLEDQIHTPLKFDILNYNTICKEELKQNIIEKGEVLYDHRKN